MSAPEQTHPLALPLHFRIAQGLIALALIVIIVRCLSCLVTARSCSEVSYGLAGFCALALAGLLRRVVWGRFLVSCVGVLTGLLLPVSLLPSLFDHPGESPLERLFGYLPPLWVNVIVVLGIAVLVLLPLVVIGWRKHYFRRAWW